MSRVLAGQMQRDLRTFTNRVGAFYDMVVVINSAAGIEELSEGIYDGEELSYEEAQLRKHDLLLDEAQCIEGSRILDIGSGAGALLRRAAERGAHCTGITLSSRQADVCRRKGIDIRILDYRNMGDEWTGRFDCIIANGSPEHFVRPQDVIDGRDDDVYREMFKICHRLLDPTSLSRRFITTMMHFNEFHPSPEKVIRHPFNFRWGSDDFHAAMVENTLGGWLAVDGQLERCASDLFALEQEVERTDDYRRTSEEWLRRWKKIAFSLKGFKAYMKLAPHCFRHPGHLFLTWMLVVSESWQWQFRGNPPPFKLMHHTWQAV